MLKNCLWCIVILLLLLTVLIVLKLGLSASTHPYQNNKLNSIVSLIEINVNGMNQWLSIRGRNKNNPVLLWLHGGPGTAQMSLAHELDQELEDHFVVVHWDQRGAGKSNNKSFSEDTMNIQQYKDDAVVVIEFLQELLEQEKIFLLGHSWGTHFGIKLVQEHPEYFHAYVGVSQVVDHVRATEIGARWLKDEIEQKNNIKDLKKLNSITLPAVQHQDYRQLINLISKYGGSFDISFVELAKISFKAPEYAFGDYIRLYKGMMRGGGPMHENGLMQAYNFIESVFELEVPIYLFSGKNDYNTPFILVEEFYESIKAPKKELIVFEDSAHMPFISEKIKFKQKLIDIICRSR